MNLKLKFRIVALATKYKNQLDFSYINNGIKEYCSYNSYLKTISNIGLLDESLSKFKDFVFKLFVKDNKLDLLHSYESYELYFQPFSQLLGLNYSVLVKIIEKYLVLMDKFVVDAIYLGCDKKYAESCVGLYLNYISIPQKYMKEYLDYVKERY